CSSRLCVSAVCLCVVVVVCVCVCVCVCVPCASIVLAHLCLKPLADIIPPCPRWRNTHPLSTILGLCVFLHRNIPSHSHAPFPTLTCNTPITPNVSSHD